MDFEYAIHVPWEAMADCAFLLKMDVINFISKVPGLPDAPITDPSEEYQPAPMYYANGYVLLYVHDK